MNGDKIALFTKLAKCGMLQILPPRRLGIFAHYLIPPPSAATALQVKVSADTGRREQ